MKLIALVILVAGLSACSSGPKIRKDCKYVGETSSAKYFACEDV